MSFDVNRAGTTAGGNTLQFQSSLPSSTMSRVHHQRDRRQWLQPAFARHQDGPTAMTFNASTGNLILGNYTQHGGHRDVNDGWFGNRLFRAWWRTARSPAGSDGERLGDDYV